MLNKRILSLVVAGLVVAAYLPQSFADSRPAAKIISASVKTPILNVSASKTDDCCQTAAPAPAPAPACKTYKPCVCYRGDFCCCGPRVSQTLLVKDSCDCCACVAEIPVCLPACCTGNPKVCCECGLFGRTIVTYSYDCGACVTIVFRRCDVVVKYSG